MKNWTLEMIVISMLYMLPCKDTQDGVWGMLNVPKYCIVKTLLLMIGQDVDVNKFIVLNTCS